VFSNSQVTQTSRPSTDIHSWVVNWFACSAKRHLNLYYTGVWMDSPPRVPINTVTSQTPTVFRTLQSDQLEVGSTDSWKLHNWINCTTSIIRLHSPSSDSFNAQRCEQLNYVRMVTQWWVNAGNLCVLLEFLYYEMSHMGPRRSGDPEQTLDALDYKLFNINACCMPISRYCIETIKTHPRHFQTNCRFIDRNGYNMTIQFLIKIYV
jgi:hypothetical protein